MHIRNGMVFCLASCASLAGGAAAPGQPTPEEIERAAIVSLDFKGGTLQEYVAAARAACEKSGYTLDVVIPSEAAAVAVPPISLRKVAPDTLLLAMRSALSDHVDFEYLEEKERGAVYVIGSPRRPEPPVLLRAYNLGRLRTPGPGEGASIPPKTALSAIEAAFSRGATRPDLKFHEESGLLLCWGTPPQQQVVQEVLMALSPMPPHFREIREMRAREEDMAAWEREARRMRELERELREEPR